MPAISDPTAVLDRWAAKARFERTVKLSAAEHPRDGWCITLRDTSRWFGLFQSKHYFGRTAEAARLAAAEAVVALDPSLASKVEG